MTSTLPTHAQVVIIGGGIHGCSVAYHLARAGWTDVVLLERKQLTSGTTWHAAGLVGQLQGSHATTSFAKYGIELLQEIEADTGQSPGYRQSGSISIALNDERFAELKRKADFARLFDIDATLMSTAEIRERWPLMNPDGVLGGIHMPMDGSANPTDLTMALAKGARQRGVRILEHVNVDEVIVASGRVAGVRTESGTVNADFVVNCAGMWARALGQKSGVGVPIHACEHYYLVTEAIRDLPSDLPVLRSYCDGTYFKEDAGKLLFGFAHNRAKPWATDGIREDFCFDSLPFIEDDVMDVLALAMNRVPILSETGIRTFFNGPESYSYDGRFTLGEAPDVKNYFVLAGVNSTGIQSGPGAGRALAEWIMAGHPTLDLAEMAPARCEAFQARDPYLQQRAPETLVLTYAMHWPNRQRETLRGLRKSPFYHATRARGAVFHETHGWERPAWYAPDGVEPVQRDTFGRHNGFEYSLEEQRAVRNAVGLIDYSMLGKWQIDGPGAEAFLQRVCTNNVAVPPGKVVYTLLLNARGGIESDVTVARLGKHTFRLMSPIARTRRDGLHLRRHLRGHEDVRITDVTTATGVLSLAGPRALDVLQAVTDSDVSHQAFPFATHQAIWIGHAETHVQRLSYTGALGYEIFVTPDWAEHVFDTLMAAGAAFGLRLVGGEALNALRLEMGYRHWGSDMSYTEAPHQLGLDGLCSADKGEFVGRAAWLARKAEGAGPYVSAVRLESTEPVLHGNEPVAIDGEVVGYICSAGYSDAERRAIGLSLVSRHGLNNTRVHIGVEGAWWAATMIDRHS
ncbi:MAG: FAD-dependent oxidoreductase [Pseudomonadota bacterium]